MEVGCMSMHIGNVSSGTALLVKSASCRGFVQPFAFFGMTTGKKCIRNLSLCASSFLGGRVNIQE